MVIAEECYVITKLLPKEELYGLTGQIRRASVSIAANIAEGYGRENKAYFVHFLRISQGSLKELETHLILASRVSLLSENDVAGILERCDENGRMLGALIRSVQRKRNEQDGSAINRLE